MIMSFANPLGVGQDVIQFRDFVRTGGADVSFQAGDLKMQVQPGDINCDWGKMGCEQHYTPATMEFEVVQRPEIHFEYLGRPAYVPPSADPEYEAEE